ncbi:MAG TPA: ABC transporter permease [Verrucomicrobiae bacterium]|nr:ABC transporter permease [Verrucomicrobiae bacterium]
MSKGTVENPQRVEAEEPLPNGMSSNPQSAIRNPQSTISPNQKAWRRFRNNRPAVISAWFLLFLVFAVIAWPIILSVTSHSGPHGKAFAIQYDPNTLTDNVFAAPSLQHWFGTDVHGRDLFSRILFGAQVSLIVGTVGASVSLVIGVLWGAIAGYLGGRWDDIMMRIVDVLYSLPSIIFVIVLITTLEEYVKRWFDTINSPQLSHLTRLGFLFIGLGAVSWLNMARIVRGQVLTLRRRAFVEASLTLGAKHRHILFQHILPNVLGIVIVYLALTVPAIILYESFLSYLGLGIEPPMASWGSLIAEGAGQINTVRVYWWLLAFPGAFLVTTLLALNFFGDGLRDAWDVRGDK